MVQDQHYDAERKCAEADELARTEYVMPLESDHFLIVFCR